MAQRLQRCSVGGCQSRVRRGQESTLKFHRFPRDESLLETWKEKLNIDEHSPLDRVCNLHFTECDYMLTNLGWKVLMPGAVPSLELPKLKVNLPIEGKYIGVNIKTEKCDLQDIDSVNSENGERTQEKNQPSSIFDVSNTKTVESLLNEVSAIIGNDQGGNGSWHQKHNGAKVSPYPLKKDVKASINCSTSEENGDQASINCSTSEENGDTVAKLYQCSECQNQYPCRFSLLFHLSLHRVNLRHSRISPHCEIVSKKKRLCCSKNGLPHTVESSDSAAESASTSCETSRQEKYLPHSFYCSFCGTIFNLRSELQAHLLTHNMMKKQSYVCYKCEKMFSNAWLLRKHVRSQHIGHQFYPCETCNRLFSNPSELKLHAKHHGFVNECPQCCTLFKERSNFLSHVQEHKFILFFACAYCQQMCSSIETIEAHLLTHDLVEAEKICCDVCKQSAGSSPESQSHYHVHQFVETLGESKSENTSNQDPQSFSVEQQQDESELGTFEVKEEPPHDDEQLKITPTFGREVEIHMFSCEDCDKTFFSKDELVNHNVEHQSNGDFTCIDCGKRCNSSKALEKHYEEHVKRESDGGWSSGEES